MNKIFEQLMKNGYCAVSYKHHPKKIKDAIKAARFRPMAKECFANAQKLVVRQKVSNLYYAEGIAVMDIGIPFEHAWIIDEENNHYDITLNPMPKILCHKKYNSNEVLKNMRKTMCYTGMDFNWLEIMKMAVFMNIPLETNIEEISNKINESFSLLRHLNKKT